MNDLNLQKLKDEAAQLAMQNVWGEKAFKINKSILRMDENNSAACTRLAKYYKLNDNIEEAKNLYLKVLTIDPTNRGAINNLNEFEREQMENDAVAKIETASKLFQVGQSSAIKGKYKLAVKLLTKAYSIEPLLKYAVGLAVIYKKMGKRDNVEVIYKQLLDTKKLQTDIEAINNEFRPLLPNLIA